MTERGASPVRGTLAGRPVVCAARGVVHLTSRQAEVLRLAAHGLSGKQIAHYLGISVRTVEDHFSAMRQRTGAHSQGELVAYGVAAGLVEPGPAVPEADSGTRHVLDCEDRTVITMMTQAEALLRPAYDLTDADDAYRYLEDETGRARTHPPGREPHQAARLAVIADMTRWPQSAQPTAGEALAALTLLASLRVWLARIEPRLIDAARAQGVTWEALAGVLHVGDRRAAQRRAVRLTHTTSRGPGAAG